MRRRSKKIKTVNNNPQTSEERNKFDHIPLDLVIEIIGRLPVKSVARFLLVSKLWETTISSRDFITSFPFRSSSQPRTLIASGEIKNWYFFSPSSSKSFLSRVSCPYPYGREDPEMYHYHYVNGLINLGYGQTQIVANPSTGISITLPRVNTWRKIAKSFFGYDSVNDQYKVLCMTEQMYGDDSDVSSQHQVFTLGAKKPWKMIDCSIPHRPRSNGVCIDSIVYYVAKTGEVMKRLSLMRFELRSDNLDIFTRLPAVIRTQSQYSPDNLINYKGKIAIPTQSTLYTFDVWIMDQDSEKHDWVKNITFSSEPWKSSLRYERVRGTTHTGEFIFSPSHYNNELYVFYYNPDMNSFRKVRVELSADFKFRHCYTRAIVFSDYVESARLLSERQFMI